MFCWVGCIYLGFPIVTDQILDEDETLNDWYVSEPDYDKIVGLAMEIRGVKLCETCGTEVFGYRADETEHVVPRTDCLC